MECNLLSTDLSNWDVSNVTSLNRALSENHEIDFDISKWDVSKVTTLESFLLRAYKFTHNIILDDPIKGSLELRDVYQAFYDISTNGSLSARTEIIRLQAGKINRTSGSDFRSPYVKELILIDMNISFNINRVPGVLGANIDNLANSVRDMTGNTSPTVVMTIDQFDSCDETIWANKNWTIAQV